MRGSLTEQRAEKQWASTDLNRAETVLLASLRGLRLAGFKSGHTYRSSM